MLNKYLENDPVFPGSSPMSLADLLQVSLPWLVSVSHKWWCPSELAPDMLLHLLPILVLSDLIDFPVFADHPSMRFPRSLLPVKTLCSLSCLLGTSALMPHDLSNYSLHSAPSPKQWIQPPTIQTRHSGVTLNPPSLHTSPWNHSPPTLSIWFRGFFS